MLVSDKLNKFTSNTFVFIVWVVGLSRQIYALHSFTHRIKSDLKQSFQCNGPQDGNGIYRRRSSSSNYHELQNENFRQGN
ncbi:hypothetical protein J3Q64DRAFT_1718611 [Phycomyces blakesleeanus]|uniref:Uncharacterized protein n=1 Tax=Phycomyces blakesleeanus TaxID=4837 RepID=A0ABR3B9U4_PHYBL